MSSDPDFAADPNPHQNDATRTTLANPRRTAIRTALATGAIIAAAGLAAGVMGSNNPTIVVGAPSDSTDPTNSTELNSGSTGLAPTSTVNPPVGTEAPTVAQTTEAPNGEVAVTTALQSSSTAVAPTTTTLLETTTTTAGAVETTKAVEATTSTATTISLSPGQLPCPPKAGAETRTATFTIAPPMCIDPKATYRAVIRTSEGVLTIALDAKKYPNTVNNFVYLSRYRFYDGLTFHRVVPKFIIQGGDPLASGRGSAGYEFADELPDKPTYNIGSVAMANGRPTQPNTNGSQFFIVVGELAKTMSPDFPLFGNVVDGKAVLRKIAALGPDPAVDSSGTPSKPVTIESITITARGEKTV